MSNRAAMFWQRLTRGDQRVWKRSDWDAFAGANWTERIMNVAVTDRFHAKQGRSTGRWILESEGRRLSVYLKRHYRLPRWRGLLAALWPGASWSPAWQEWQHLNWADGQGLPVPAAVAAGEYLGPWGRLQSFLAIEELAGMLPLNEAIPVAARRLDATTFARWKRGLIAEMARLTRELHTRRWFHKDLYLCHFYIAEADLSCVPTWNQRVYVIDLHRLGRHPWTWLWWQIKDLAQLLYSSAIEGVTERDRRRFWRGYVNGGRAPLLVRWGVALKSWNYRRHNKKRERSF